MLIFRKLMIGAIGAILNFLLFGAANLCVGQIRLALAKIFLYLIYIFGVVFILDWIDITLLETALEQQALREMYLSFTQARYLLVIINSKNSIPSSLIQSAISNGLIQIKSGKS